MAATHNEDIKDLLSVIPVIPDKLMIEYLMRRFDMTPEPGTGNYLQCVPAVREEKAGVLRDERRAGPVQRPCHEQQDYAAVPRVPRCVRVFAGEQGVFTAQTASMAAEFLRGRPRLLCLRI